MTVPGYVLQCLALLELQTMSTLLMTLYLLPLFGSFLDGVLYVMVWQITEVLQYTQRI